MSAFTQPPAQALTRCTPSRFSTHTLSHISTHTLSHVSTHALSSVSTHTLHLPNHPRQSSGILWLGAGGIWLSALMMVFLPVEMRNRQMF